MCPCFDITSGFETSGVCMAPNKCLGQKTDGMMPMLPMIPMMMPMMMMPPDPCSAQGIGGVGGFADKTASSSAASSTPPCNSGGVPQFDPGIFDTSSYFNNNSSSSNLFDSLNGSGGGVSNYLVVASGTIEVKPPPEAPLTPTTTGSLFGAIKISATGATILANLRQGVTEVAGFFGGNTFNALGAPSIVGRLCATRPWAQSSFLAAIIPPGFFDALCAKAGYQVGIIPTTYVPPITQIYKRPATPPPMPPMNLGPVSVEIWAEPPAVRLGTRTYIFWNAKGVLTCEVTGPNFTQKSLSGGASTVPLSGPTTYSIECAAPDGTKTDKSVTVNLAI